MKPGHPPNPVAFEVSINGRRICTASLRGRLGVLTVILDWMKRLDCEETELVVGGLDSASREHLTWAKRRLKMGDELMVKINSAARTSRVMSRQQMQDQKVEQKHEKSLLRRFAKKYGYKLVKV